MQSSAEVPRREDRDERLAHRQTCRAVAAVMVAIEASPELVRLGKDVRGRERLTTWIMLETERRLEAAAVTLSARQTHAVPLAGRQAAVTASTLGQEQAHAFLSVTRARDLAVVVGYAGTGKSTMLGVARLAWEAEGYRVRGAALSGIAAEGLEGKEGDESRAAMHERNRPKVGRSARLQGKVETLEAVQSDFGDYLAGEPKRA